MTFFPTFCVLGPSGRPKFIRERLSTSSTSLSLVWAPPPQFTINAEFRGYQLTYKPSNYIMANTTAIQINVRDSISVQVRIQKRILIIKKFGKNSPQEMVLYVYENDQVP